MAPFEDESTSAPPETKTAAHVVGEPLDALSATELTERIEALRREIERLEGAIRAREATRRAASAIFKI